MRLLGGFQDELGTTSWNDIFQLKPLPLKNELFFLIFRIHTLSPALKPKGLVSAQ
jgi:hypothetical protein